MTSCETSVMESSINSTQSLVIIDLLFSLSSITMTLKWLIPWAQELGIKSWVSEYQYLQLIEGEGGSRHSVTYGINGRSPLLDLVGFDITKCLPYDIMHTVFEGVDF